LKAIAAVQSARIGLPIRPQGALRRLKDRVAVAIAFKLLFQSRHARLFGVIIPKEKPIRLLG
jgi:hypothetical protein